MDVSLTQTSTGDANKVRDMLDASDMFSSQELDDMSEMAKSDISGEEDGRT